MVTSLETVHGWSVRDRARRVNDLTRNPKIWLYIWLYNSAVSMWEAFADSMAVPTPRTDDCSVPDR